MLSNPYTDYFLYRDPNNKHAGKIVSLEDFLNIAKNATSLYGVLIRIEVSVFEFWTPVSRSFFN